MICVTLLKMEANRIDLSAFDFAAMIMGAVSGIGRSIALTLLYQLGSDIFSAEFRTHT